MRRGSHTLNRLPQYETATDDAESGYRFLLERPVIDTPAGVLREATALLARMISKRHAHNFARENLFDLV
jgi:hypothetical protein